MDKYINYIEEFNQFEENISELKKQLEIHQADFNKNPNWHYLHDLEMVNKHLKLIIDII